MWQSICETIGAYIICAIAVERATECLTQGEVFMWLRYYPCQWQIQEHNKINKRWKFICKLTTCGYCMSHWVSLGFVWFLPGEYFTLAAAGNVVIKWLALLGLSNLFHSVFNLIYRGRVFTADILLKRERATSEDDSIELDEGDDGEP